MFEFRVTRRALAPLAVMVLALGAAACGGDDDEEASTVPITVLPPRVAEKTRQYLASGPEPVFT